MNRELFKLDKMNTGEVSSLIRLVDVIKTNVLVLDEHLCRQGHSNLSLGVNGVPISIASHEKEILAARDKILSTTRELQNLILGPVGILMNIGVRPNCCVLLVSTNIGLSISSGVNAAFPPCFFTVVQESFKP